MQQVWRNRWRNAVWALLSASTLVLLVAAIQKKQNKVCVGIKISFVNPGNNYFIDERAVLNVLKTDGEVQGNEINKVNLGLLESRLKQDTWIADADLFFDNKQMLQVSIQEREPIARIFTMNRNSYYIDSTCSRLPLSETVSARVPMFTSFPSDRKVLARPDSELLADIKELAMVINADDFWTAQVQQIDITPTGFDMFPLIGNHVVVLGKGDYQKKFDRLFSFYKQVWIKVGFERYEKFDLQFDGQVVATIKGSSHVVVDTSKAKELLNNLIIKDKQGADTVQAVDPVPVAQVAQVGTDEAAKHNSAPVKKASAKSIENIAKTAAVVPAKPADEQAKVVVVKTAAVKNEQSKAKAIMKKTQ